MIRMLSDGFPGFKGNTIGVVDERSEIGACYKGVPQMISAYGRIFLTVVQIIWNADADPFDVTADHSGG